MKALECLETSPLSGQLGWEVLINPDEEIGSTSSKELFAEAAKRHFLGLVYEPAFSDGSLVSSRKGSSNYTLVSKGRSAHAGRDFHLGRNAITALARCVAYIDSLSKIELGLTVNVAHFESHYPSNIVPDIALCRINVRAKTLAQLEEVEKLIHKIAKDETKNDIVIEVHHETSSPPKPFDDTQQYLYKAIQETGSALGISLPLKESGGTCDGSRLYAYGLPNIDSMGVIGGGLHTEEEYCLTDSIVERAALSSLFLMNLASGDLKIDFKEKVR
jgi:glutamate carboxypeptidase